MNMKKVVEMEQALRGEPADARQVSGSHYTEMKLQPWHAIKALLTREEWGGFLKGNVIKYAMRQGRKAGSDDAGKALHYLDKLREEGF